MRHCQKVVILPGGRPTVQLLYFSLKANPMRIYSAAYFELGGCDSLNRVHWMETVVFHENSDIVGSVPEPIFDKKCYFFFSGLYGA